MPRLVKAYSERESTIIEVSVIGMSERGAKAKALAWALSGRQIRATEYESVRVDKLTGDGLSEYRVNITVNADSSIRDRIAKKVSDML